MTYRLDKTPLEGVLGDFKDPVRLVKVDETKWEAYWDGLVDRYHYLGYTWQMGGRVKYLITLGDRILGAIGFCSAVYRLEPRDAYIGWDDGTRVSLLPHMVGNNRFLILPFVRIRNLASHVLSMGVKRLRLDWRAQYGVDPYMVETFVDPERFSGCCYRAAGWVFLGKTQGYGRQGGGFVRHGMPKDIYVKVTDRRFASRFRPDPGRLKKSGTEELATMINGMHTIWTPSLIHRMGIPDAIARGADGINGALTDHIQRYLPYLGRKEHERHFVTRIMGCLSDDMKRKSNEPVAMEYAGVDQVRNLANFMGRDKWDHEGMLKEYQREVAGILFEPGGMITGDGCDFPKKGKNSAGVCRQYCGPLGKTDNCQASAMVGYAGMKGYALMDHELYMPRAWFDAGHAKLRKQNRVPESLKFKTKNQMLLDMIWRIAGLEGFQGCCVGVDSSFGSDRDFLDSLPEWLVYFADVHCNILVFNGRPDFVTAPYCGRGRRPVPKPETPPVEVKTFADDDSFPWEDTVLGIGAKGPVIVKDKLIPVVEVRDDKPGKDVWLYVRRLEDGAIKYSLCNAPPDAPPDHIRSMALMRWAIEQCFHEGKDIFGMDHYEVRSFPGWYRHMLICRIAALFVLKLRMQFSVRHRSAGCVPYVVKPVPLDDYLKAVECLRNNVPIEHPHIKPYSTDPQQLLTSGLAVKLVTPFFAKVGTILGSIDFQLKNMANSFCSHSNTKLNDIIVSRDSKE